MLIPPRRGTHKFSSRKASHASTNSVGRISEQQRRRSSTAKISSELPYGDFNRCYGDFNRCYGDFNRCYGDLHCMIFFMNSFCLPGVADRLNEFCLSARPTSWCLEAT